MIEAMFHLQALGQAKEKVSPLFMFHKLSKIA